MPAEWLSVLISASAAGEFCASKLSRCLELKASVEVKAVWDQKKEEKSVFFWYGCQNTYSGFRLWLGFYYRIYYRKNVSKFFQHDDAKLCNSIHKFREHTIRSTIELWPMKALNTTFSTNAAVASQLA